MIRNSVEIVQGHNEKEQTAGWIMTTIRQQALIWTNDCPVYWRTYSSFGLVEFTRPSLELDVADTTWKI